MINKLREAVIHLLSLRSTSAFAVSSSLQISTWPQRAHMCSGVLPLMEEKRVTAADDK